MCIRDSTHTHHTHTHTHNTHNTHTHTYTHTHTHTHAARDELNVIDLCTLACYLCACCRLSEDIWILFAWFCGFVVVTFLIFWFLTYNPWDRLSIRCCK